jgi:tripartite-type tricarboxylate transporter receptor subunit TctC
MGGLLRRGFLRLAGAAAASAVVLSSARAEDDYPSRPIRWLVGFPPGGGGDIVARIMAAAMAERLGQAVVVENKPGASTNLSIEAVAKAPPDGYTLLFIAASAAVNVSLFRHLPFDLMRDIAPVGGLIDFPLVMVATRSLPAKTIAELIAYARSHPRQLSIGSFGVGSTSHVAGELFKQLAGVDMVHVPYRGGAPMMTDLVAGNVQVAFDVMTGALPHIRSGDIRALAVAGKARYPGLPDVPTIGDTMPLYVANSWCGVGVPHATPGPIIARLNHAINASLADPAVKGRIAAVATTPMPFAPDAFRAYVGSEIEKWRTVISAANIRLE